MDIILDGTNKTYNITKNELINFTTVNDDEVLLIVNGAKVVDLSGEFTTGNIRIIIFNISDVDIEIVENYQVKGADVKIAVGHFSKASINHIQKANLLSSDSTLDFSTYSLAYSSITIDQLIVNDYHNTSASMANYAVCLKDSRFKLSANGTINSGAYQSSSHQVSKCLTFDELNKVEALPILVINENDVEASHAMSVGQINENQLFYLESRGLSSARISELVTYGYVLPLSRIFSDDKRNSDLKVMIEERVQELCLM